jgi:tetratricopeptide (TPR) repeat protein
MGRNFSFQMEDDSNELVQRYEKYLTGADSGYFDVDEMAAIVEYYLSHGRTNDSLEALKFGLRLHPASNLLNVKRAKLYLATGDISKAYHLLNNLVEDSDTEIVYLKIKTLLKLHRAKDAFEFADNYINHEEFDIDWICVDIAMLFTEEYEFNLALQILQKGEASNPKNLDILFDMAFCQEQKGQYDQAIETYNRIIELDPYNDEVWSAVGQLYFILKDYEKAIEAYDFALIIDENDSLSLLQKAHALFQLEKWKDALEVYTAYSEMVSEKWQVWTFIGECYEKLEDFENAIVFYRKSLDESEDNFDALEGMAIGLLELERFDESLEYIYKAIKLNQLDFEIWIYLGEAMEGLYRWEEALAAYKKSIALNSNQPDTLFDIGNIYMEIAEFKSALKYYKLAYSFDSTREFIELFIAVAAFYTGNYTECEKFLKLAVQRNLDAAKMFLELCPGAASFFD